MSSSKQWVLIALAAAAIALMVFSYYRAFLSGPGRLPPSAGEKWKAAMRKAIQDEDARRRARQAGQHSPGAHGADSGAGAR